VIFEVARWRGARRRGTLNLPREPTGHSLSFRLVGFRQTARHPREALRQRTRVKEAKRSLASWRTTDVEGRASLQPPPEELIQHRIVWVADAYGPAQVEGLIAGVRAAGWDEESVGRRPSEWIRQIRGAASSWGHTSIKPLVPRDAQGFFAVTPSELPAGVQIAFPSITTLPGSLTVLVVCFVLDRDTGLGVDQALRAEYSTELIAVGPRRASFAPPETGQRDAVVEARRALRELLARWIVAQSRGVFGEQDAGALPAAELLTHRTNAVLRGDIETEWPFSLDLGGPLWRATKWPDINMFESYDRLEGERTLRLRAREDAILPRKGQAGEALSEDAAWHELAGRLNRSFGGTVTLWTATCLVRDYFARLASLRDVAPAVGLGTRRAADRLTEAQRELALTADARVVAADIQRWPGAFIFRRWDDNDWEEQGADAEPEGEEPEQPRPWIDLTAAWCMNSAQGVLDAEDRMRQRLVVEAELIGAGASLRVQRLALLVAVLALFVAVAAVVVSSVSLSSNDTSGPPSVTVREVRTAPSQPRSEASGHRLRQLVLPGGPQPGRTRRKERKGHAIRAHTERAGQRQRP
jgi:hypothetical protein